MEEYKIKVAKYKATRDNIFNITIIFNNFVNIPEGTYEVKECCGFDNNGSYLSIKPSTDKISRTNDVKRCTTANGHSRFMFTQKHDYFDDYIGLYNKVVLQREHGSVVELRLYRQDKEKSDTGLIGHMTGNQHTVKNTPKPVVHKETKPVVETPVETPIAETVKDESFVDVKTITLFNSLLQTIELFALDNGLREEYDDLENIRGRIMKRLTR